MESTGVIAHKDILANAHDIREPMVWIASDNRAAIAWSTKGSATSLAARAYLLQYNAVQQPHHCDVARHHYIPGTVHAMADDASRLWALSDTHLLAHSQSHYPQARSWVMHHLPPDTNALLTGALFKKQPTIGRVSRQRAASADASWRLWEAFCATLGVDPRHLGSTDPVPLLQLFAHRYRTGSIAPGRNPVRSRTVEDAVRAVGQACARMWAPDPRLTRHGDIDLRLTALYRSWGRADTLPSRVKPLPVSVVAQVWALAHQDASAPAIAAAECLVLGFYFLLHPGEYLGSPARPHRRLPLSSP